MATSRRNPPTVQPDLPVIAYDHARASQAYAAHAAMLRQQADQPALRDNPFWTMLRQDAFERFSEAFQVIA